MLLKGMLTGEDTIQNHLTQQTYSRLASHLKESNQPLELFSKLRPWLCAMTLTMAEFQKAGMHSDYGIESYFFLKAVQDKKNISGLVPVNEHIDILASLDNEEQELFLLQTLDELDKVANMSEDLQKNWLSGNTVALDALINESSEKAPEVYEKLIYERNRQWLGKIESYLRNKEKVLVIVGAGHLVGKNSVVELLQAKGYEVVQQ